jgi:hypothetical protein
LAQPSFAQAPAGKPAPSASAAIEESRGWSAQAGYEVFSLRDISRSGKPPDASPIAWRGTGHIVSGRYEITGLKSAHFFDGSVSRNSDFVYEAPTRSAAANDSDFASRFDARYEYRRYPWRDAGFDGFDIGLGAQGAGTRQAFDRHITPALLTKTRITGGGLAGVVAVRIRRWQRFTFDASWANGAIVSLRTAEHSANPTLDESFSGGNYLSDLMVRGDWTLTRATRLEVTWRRGFDYYASDHFSYSGLRQSINVGVRYAY